MEHRFLSMDDLLAASEAALGEAPKVRDWGLLDSALARPRAVVFGVDVYPGLHAKAAALVHSAATSDALIDGNKRTALAAMWLFLAFNGERLGGSDDDRYALMMDVAEGNLVGVEEIAARIRTLCEPL